MAESVYIFILVLNPFLLVEVKRSTVLPEISIFRLTGSCNLGCNLGCNDVSR